MECTIHIGIKNEHKEEVARLYAIAFQHKFQKILGEPAIIASLLQEGINPERCISAVSEENELLGVAGFNLNNSSFVNLQLRTIITKFGIWKGTFKFLLIAVLFYRKPDDEQQMLMDGIAVKEEYRGKGVGKMLFAKLEEYALSQTMLSIKLDVIDENPNAKKLYQSIGFSQKSYTKIPKFISNLIGVSGVTSMVKKL